MTFNDNINKAEVLVENSEKEELVKLLTQADNLLSKYEYSNDYSIHYVTVMSRAKSAVAEAKKWCELLHTKE